MVCTAVSVFLMYCISIEQHSLSVIVMVERPGWGVLQRDRDCVGSSAYHKTMYDMVSADCQWWATPGATCWLQLGATWQGGATDKYSVTTVNGATDNPQRSPGRG